MINLHIKEQLFVKYLLKITYSKKDLKYAGVKESNLQIIIVFAGTKLDRYSPVNSEDYYLCY